MCSGRCVCFPSHSRKTETQYYVPIEKFYFRRAQRTPLFILIPLLAAPVVSVYFGRELYIRSNSAVLIVSTTVDKAIC